MQHEFLEVKQTRFSLSKPNEYILQGKWPKGAEPEAWVGKQKLPIRLVENETVDALERFKESYEHETINVYLYVELPDEISPKEDFKILAVDGYNHKKVWWHIGGRKLLESRNKPQFFLEDIQPNHKQSSCTVSGWVAYGEEVAIELRDLKGRKLPFELKRYRRVDVENAFPEIKIGEQSGFWFHVENLKVSSFNLCFSAQQSYSQKYISINPIVINGQKIAENCGKAMRYSQYYGIRSLPIKITEKLTNRDKPILYKDWIKKHLPNEKQLQQQRLEKFVIEPQFSIVVPLYKTPIEFLDKLIESVYMQTYQNWELCLSDGSGCISPLSDYLAKKAGEDSRIKVVSHKVPMKISDNTNAAISIANGDYIVFADHDDLLEWNALYECAKVINENACAEVIYSDEDKVSISGKNFFQPQMKPDFNIDLLCSVNYICHLFVVKNTLLQKIGLLRQAFDGAQDYDFILRCVENTNQIYHIPKILYHWRSHEKSTAENPESKLYAFEAGRRAVQAHYERIGIPVEVLHGEFLGLYRTRFIMNQTPLISIIIPNKDHAEDLKRCIDSIEKHSSYKNYEYIIVENNSVEQSTFDYYRNLENANKNVKIVYWKEEFNYSKINNFGVGFARGEYLLLLNNDTEIINSGCLEELLGYCMRSDVGAVGARLYYDDDTIQHAGVVIGFGGIAGHCFVQQKRGATGYCHRIICAQDYSAVTAACMMVKRSVFYEVGGLTEEFAVAFNDIDFCLKIRKAGYLIVYNPYAELYHYESKSRGLDDTPEKVARFSKEIDRFEKTWPDILKQGDPYYNPNLTLKSQDFSLRKN